MKKPKGLKQLKKRLRQTITDNEKFKKNNHQNNNHRF